jgi:uridine phosphorylase
MLSMLRTVDAILVPQGAEYQSVHRGVYQVTGISIPVLPMPMGKPAFAGRLKHLLETGELHPKRTPTVLLMGLCGSLAPDYGVGDVVIYTECRSMSSDASLLHHECCLDLVTQLQNGLGTSTALVKGWTSDRVIHLATEKQQLRQTYGADVVDMEGMAALEGLQVTGIAVGMVRVVGDDCQYDIPDLSGAIDDKGRVRSLPTALALLRQPIAATRFIRSSLWGLRRLQSVATQLVTAPNGL